jgi:hypothetical protein
MPTDATICGETSDADSNTLKEKIDRKPEELGNYQLIVDAYNPGWGIKIWSNCDLFISAVPIELLPAYTDQQLLMRPKN